MNPREAASADSARTDTAPHCRGCAEYRPHGLQGPHFIHKFGRKETMGASGVTIFERGLSPISVRRPAIARGQAPAFCCKRRLSASVESRRSVTAWLSTLGGTQGRTRVGPHLRAYVAHGSRWSRWPYLTADAEAQGGSRRTGNLQNFPDSVRASVRPEGLLPAETIPADVDTWPRSYVRC